MECFTTFFSTRRDQFFGPIQSESIQKIRMNHFINQTDFQSFFTIHRFTSKNDIQSRLQTDDTWHTHATTKTRQDAELNFWKTDFRRRVFADNTVITGHHKLTTATHAGAVDRSNRHHRKVFHHIHDLLTAADSSFVLFFCCHGFDFFDICTRNENSWLRRFKNHSLIRRLFQILNNFFKSHHDWS
ncbi:hypothetical protein D3C87_1427000 [compost metagenome]